MNRTIKKIVIHCAATPNGVDIKTATLDAGHKARGFKRNSQYVRNFNPNLKHIGYHYIIEVDGKIVTGRHLEEVGAHVAGQNANSIGICMMGTDSFSVAQWGSLKKVLCELASKIYGKPTDRVKNALAIFKLIGIHICGHRDCSPDKDGDGVIEKHEWLKICPGFDVASWLDELRRELPEEVRNV